MDIKDKNDNKLKNKMKTKQINKIIYNSSEDESTEEEVVNTDGIKSMYSQRHLDLRNKFIETRNRVEKSCGTNSDTIDEDIFSEKNITTTITQVMDDLQVHNKYILSINFTII